jgi:putative FmdB family regulatory protein
VPTYQYACTECGEPLEVVQKFTDEPLTECPACHGRLRKVFNSVGIVFKGSGFYRTDSRDSAKSKSKAGADAATPSPTSTTSSTAPSTGDSSSSSSSSPATTSSGSSSSAPAAKAASA